MDEQHCILDDHLISGNEAAIERLFLFVAEGWGLVKMRVVFDSDVIKEKLMKQFEGDLFPPEKSLLTLPVVYLTVSVIVLLAAVMAVSIGFQQHLILNLSEEGYKAATGHFKVPLSILALTIPVVALLASNHRSVQTKRQMELTNSQIALTTSQNRFANYFKHLEEFGKICSKFDSGLVTIKSVRRLHRILFPDARNGDFQVSQEFIKNFNSLVSSFTSSLEGFENADLCLKSCIQILWSVREFARQNEFSAPVHPEDKKIDTHEGALYMPLGGLTEFVRRHLEFIRMVSEVVSFDPDYEPSDELQRVLRVNVSLVPPVTLPHDFKSFKLLDVVLAE